MSDEDFSDLVLFALCLELSALLMVGVWALQELVKWLDAND